MKRRKGFYSISVVAKMFSVHQQTIRMYEKEGLISPKRSEGNTRLFSEEDVDRLEEVIYLTHKLGVNLAGVEMILKLEKKIKKMQDEMNKIFQSTEGEIARESQLIRQDMRKQAERLVAIRKENIVKKHEDLIDVAGPAVDEEPKRKQTKKQTDEAKVKMLAPTYKIDDDEDIDLVDDIEIEYEK